MKAHEVYFNQWKQGNVLPISVKANCDLLSGFSHAGRFFTDLGAVGNRFYKLVVVLLVRLRTRCVEQSSKMLNTRIIKHLLVYSITL